MEKLKFIIYFFKFKAQCRSIFQSVCLSVCLHSPVQCANITSYKLLDCLLIHHSLTAYISLVCNVTLLRDASVLVDRATAKSKPVINNEQNEHKKRHKKEQFEKQRKVLSCFSCFSIFKNQVISTSSFLAS